MTQLTETVQILHDVFGEGTYLPDPTRKPCDETPAPVRAEDSKLYRNECEAKMAGQRGPFESVSLEDYEATLADQASERPPYYAPDQEDDEPVHQRARAASPVGGMRPETARTAPKLDFRESVKQTLQSVFGEGQRYGGYWVPQIAMIKMKGGGSGFPFRTAAAEKVFQTAKQLIPKFPEATALEIKKDAINKAEVIGTELTPEDEALLDIAIHFAQTGRDDILVTPPIVNRGLNGKGSDVMPRGFK